MSIKGQLPKFSDIRPKLTVIGVGGAGCNAVNNMIASGLDGVDFIVANTDAQALAASAAEVRIQLGATLTEGLGAGSRPEIGEAAAEEAIEDIRKEIAGSHMVFIAAGMGGGTGTGAASVIARAARELGILTVGVVTKPFLFEGARRMRVAEVGVAELRNFVDTLIVIPNQNLFRVASEKTTFSEAFVMADQVLYSGVACIVDLIIKEGLINLDFADVRTIMSGMGSAMMGTGEASGDRRATLAAEEAISNPLIDDVSLRGAKGLLLSITGGSNLTLYEVDEAASRVRQEVDPEANIIVGATYDPNLGDRVRVSIVASGMVRPGEAERAPPAPVENWGGRSVPAAPAPMAEPPVHAHVPPQAPSAQPPRQSEDMQRRLTAALQYAAAGQAPQPAAPAAHARELWRAPGNVTIEEAAPQLPAAHVPPPIPNAMDPRVLAAQGSGFTPAAPSEIRRDGRRMPDVGDFPQVGQRAYRAMEQGTVPRRPGLFERLAGVVRGDTDSQVRAQGGRSTYQQLDHGAPNAHSDATLRSPSDLPVDAGHETDQRLEMPMIFNRRR